MSYLFDDKEVTLKMVKGSFKKFKSRIFYDKTLLFIKKKVAEFESNRENFFSCLENIACALNKSDYSYFESLIKKIDFNVLPKKFVSEQETSIVSSTTDHNKKIAKINFFIDMPIELHIIDFLWMLLIGKIMKSYSFEYKYAAATKFKNGLYLEDASLTDGIDFESNRAYMPYFKLYSNWRDGAFDIIEHRNQNDNLILICLDLKSFYYSVEFNFNDLKNKLHNDERLETFQFLTDIINRIYSQYTKILREYKAGIRNSANSCIFPIGVDSATVLREIYLAQFDKKIVSALSPLYYNRYVDDMLIVLKDEEYLETSVEEVLKRYFILTKIAFPVAEDLKFRNYPNIRIQTSKANCFYFPKGQKAILVDVYNEIIQRNSSEGNLLPDISVLNASFTSSAYNIENFENSHKLRDLGFLVNNNYKATRYLSDFQRLVKNTAVDLKSLDKYFDQIEEFYQGSQSVEYSNNWRGLFELYLLCKNQERGLRYYKNCREQIKSLSFEKFEKGEILKKKYSFLLRKLKKDLYTKLDISISLAGALNYKLLKAKRLIDLAKLFRTSNLLNHNMTSYPLINYLTNETISLTESNLSSLIDECKNNFELDKFKLDWTPRYISAIEFFIVDFLHNFNKSMPIHDPNEVYKRFMYYNNINYYPGNEILAANYSGDNINIVKLAVKKEKFKEHKVAVVNTKIEEDDILDYLDDYDLALSLKAKSSLFKILNAAHEEHAEFIVFPEFYLPIAWLYDVAKFAVEKNMNVITGLQYITTNKAAFNNVCTIIPYRLSKRFVSGQIQFREKNFYAPKEKIALSKKGYICKDNGTPFYYVYDCEDYSFTSILCYEFTDIHSRAVMKSKVDLLFVPQLNRDTNYFSSIVDSAARDLHCFVVQANTSVYGDSRVTAPYRTLDKNILQVKGGETDVVMIGKIEIDKLIKYRKTYQIDLKNSILACLHCKKVKCKPAKNYVNICKKCQYNLIDNKIKGTPPQFN